MEKYDFPRDIQNVANTLDHEKVLALLELASKSRITYDLVAKSIVHYTCLGNEDIHPFVRELILELEEMEERIPDIRPKENIVNKMVATLRGLSDKRDLTQTMIKQCEWRVNASLLLLHEISKKRPLKVAMPLLAGGQHPEVRKHGRNLIHQILKRRLGSTDIETLKSLVAITTAVIGSDQRSEEKTDNRRRWERFVFSIVNKMIEEGENPFIYFAGPLLCAMRSGEGMPKVLLDKILEKPFGNLDAEMLIELSKIISAIISLENSSSITQYEYALKIGRKTIVECENAPVYFLKNLIVSARSTVRSVAAEELMEVMKNHIRNGSKLGIPDEVTHDELIRCINWYHSQDILTDHVEFFIKQMGHEGLWKGPLPRLRGSCQYEGPRWKLTDRKHRIPKEHLPTKPDYLRSKLRYRR